jgi:branched-chain amino acid transport system permease protein
LVVGRLSSGRTGRALRMIREHDVGAPALGLRVGAYKVAMFGVSAALIGVEGALTFHLNGSTSEDGFPFLLSVEYIAMILIGGVDSVAGALLGAALVTCLPIVLPDLLTSALGNAASQYGAQIAEVVYGLLVVVFITYAPEGLVGLTRLASSGLRASRYTTWLFAAIPGSARRVQPRTGTELPESEQTLK